MELREFSQEDGTKSHIKRSLLGHSNYLQKYESEKKAKQLEEYLKQMTLDAKNKRKVSSHNYKNYKQVFVREAPKEKNF